MLTLSLKENISKQHGSVGHNLDLKYVFIFTYMKFVIICLQYESNSKRVLRLESLFRLSSIILNKLRVLQRGRRVASNFRVEKGSSQSGDNGRTFWRWSTTMHTLPANLYTSSSWFLSLQTSVLVPPRNRQCHHTHPWFWVLHWGGIRLKMRGQGILQTLVMCLSQLLTSKIHNHFNFF